MPSPSRWIPFPRSERPMAFQAVWDLVLLGADGTVKDRRRFKNLIVNAGLEQAKDRLFNPATVAPAFGYVAIRTGAVAETPVDVALGTEAARDAVAYVPFDADAKVAASAEARKGP